MTTKDKTKEETQKTPEAPKLKSTAVFDAMKRRAAKKALLDEKSEA